MSCFQQRSGSRLDLSNDVRSRLDLSDNAEESTSSLHRISQCGGTGAPADLKKTRARRVPATASEFPAAPKKKRRKPGFDLGSILDREMARASGHLSASSSQPHVGPLSTDLSTGCLTRRPDAPESEIGSGSRRVSESEVIATSDASLCLERALAPAGGIELDRRIAPARKIAPASDMPSASDMALALF